MRILSLRYLASGRAGPVDHAGRCRADHQHHDCSTGTAGLRAARHSRARLYLDARASGPMVRTITFLEVPGHSGCRAASGRPSCGTPGYWGWHDGYYSWNASYWGIPILVSGRRRLCLRARAALVMAVGATNGGFAYNRTVNNFVRDRGDECLQPDHRQQYDQHHTGYFNGVLGGTTAQPTPQAGRRAPTAHRGDGRTSPARTYREHQQSAARVRKSDGASGDRGDSKPGEFTVRRVSGQRGKSGFGSRPGRRRRPCPRHFPAPVPNRLEAGRLPQRNAWRRRGASGRPSQAMRATNGAVPPKPLNAVAKPPAIRCRPVAPHPAAPRMAAQQQKTAGPKAAMLRASTYPLQLILVAASSGSSSAGETEGPAA